MEPEDGNGYATGFRGEALRKYLYRLSCAVCRARNTWYTTTSDLASVAAGRATARVSLTRLNAPIKYLNLSFFGVAVVATLTVAYCLYLSSVLGAVLEFDPDALRSQPSLAPPRQLSPWPLNVFFGTHSTPAGSADAAGRGCEGVECRQPRDGALTTLAAVGDAPPYSLSSPAVTRLEAAAERSPAAATEKHSVEANTATTVPVPSVPPAAHESGAEPPRDAGPPLITVALTTAAESSTTRQSALSHHREVVLAYSKAIKQFVMSYKYEAPYILSTLLMASVVCACYLVSQWSYELLLYQLTRAASIGVGTQMKLQARGMLDNDFKNYLAALREIFYLDASLDVWTLRQTHEILLRNFDVVTKVNLDYELDEAGMKLRPPGWKPPQVQRGLFGELFVLIKMSLAREWASVVFNVTDVFNQAVFLASRGGKGNPDKNAVVYFKQMQRSRRTAIDQQLKKVTRNWKKRQFRAPPRPKTPAELLQSELARSKKTLLEFIGPDNVVRYVGIREYCHMRTNQSKHLLIVFLFRLPLWLSLVIYFLCCLEVVVISNISSPALLQNWNGPILLSPYFFGEWTSVVLTGLNVLYLVVLNLGSVRLQLLERLLGLRVDSLVGFANILVSRREFGARLQIPFRPFFQISAVWSVSVESSLAHFVCGLQCGVDEMTFRATQAVRALRRRQMLQQGDSAGRPVDPNLATGAALEVVHPATGETFHYAAFPRRDKHAIEFRWTSLAEEAPPAFGGAGALMRRRLQAEPTPASDAASSPLADLFEPAAAANEDGGQSPDEAAQIEDTGAAGLRKEYQSSRAVEILRMVGEWLQRCNLRTFDEEEATAAEQDALRKTDTDRDTEFANDDDASSGAAPQRPGPSHSDGNGDGGIDGDGDGVAGEYVEHESADETKPLAGRETVGSRFAFARWCGGRDAAETASANEEELEDGALAAPTTELVVRMGGEDQNTSETTLNAASLKNTGAGAASGTANETGSPLATSAWPSQESDGTAAAPNCLGARERLEDDPSRPLLAPPLQPPTPPTWKALPGSARAGGGPQGAQAIEALLEIMARQEP